MKNENILFSVIVPIYNAEIYLYDCIKSILNQTYANFELILVNDGSTDSSDKICKKFERKDPRIKYLMQENKGQAIARNLALKHANGDYIIFIDADDWVYKNYFETCYEIINKYKIDLICFPGKFSDSKRKIEYNKNNLDNYSIDILDNYETMEAYVKYKTINTAMWSKVYSKKLWKNLKFPNIKCKEDAYIMHTLLSTTNKTAICNKDYYFYYIRNDSTERKAMNRDRFISIEIGKNCLELCEEKYKSLYYYCYCNIYMERKKNLLIEITNKKCYLKYHNEFKKIYKDLQNDIKKLDDDCKKFKNDRYTNIFKIKIWAFHPYLSMIIHKIIKGRKK